MEKKHDCVECAKKHLSQALVLLEEILNGYQGTDHEIYCMGHLAEASSHLLDQPVLAQNIRTLRKELFEDKRPPTLTDLENIKTMWKSIQSSAPNTTLQKPVLSPDRVCVITPTGDRPLTLKILRDCIESQTVKPNKWIIIDDGQFDSSIIVRDLPYVSYVKRPRTESGNTIKENMLKAFDICNAQNIIIMEDDDWYAPDYIESMLEGLKHNKLVGIRPYMYYSLKTKSYMIRGQRNSMSIWATTAFHPDLIPEIRKVINITKDHSIDINVWNALGQKFGYVFEKDHMMHVGIKNAPGRNGTTGTHDKESLGTFDPDGSFLKKIVGSRFFNMYNKSHEIMDVVLHLGTGSKFDNMEVRMALRSIQTNFLQLGNIYVVAEKLPVWMTGVKHIQVPDVSNSGKDAILINKVLAACKLPELSENFMFWSDDQVLVKPTALWEIASVVADTPIDTMGNSKWQMRMIAIKELLEEKGITNIHNWESHVPQPMNKTTFIELMSSLEYDTGVGFGINTLYFGLQNYPPIRKQNECKLTLEGAKLCCGGIPKAVRGKTWIGYNDAGFQNGLSNWLKNNFPAPSKYENDIVMPIVESLPQAVMDNGPTSPTITFAMLFEKKELILKQFPDLKTHYDEIEAKKAANPQWREGNLVMYVNPLMLGFMDSCVKNKISPYEILSIS